MQREDILNRQPFIDKVLKILEMLSNDKKGCAFAIDGRWGTGKSFILDRIERKLLDVQREETNDDRYYVFHYNCWQYDYYDEPAVAILSAMLDKANSVVENTSKAVWVKAKEILSDVARDFVKNKIGIDVVGVVEDIYEKTGELKAKERTFDDMFAFKKTLDRAKESIKQIAEERTIIILVDELDRCLPQYAIKVLERLHHLFDGVDNTIVVLAIDSMQLSHSINGLFGGKVNQKKYLKKFLDFKLELDYGNVQNNIWEQYNTYFKLFENVYFNDTEKVHNIVKRLFDAAQFDIREKEKIIEKAECIHKLVCNGKCDCGVMLFELFCVIYETSRREHGAYPDMKILADINEAPQSDVYASIGEKLFNFFIDVEKSCYDDAKQVIVNKSFFVCNSSVSVASYLLKEIFIGGINKLGDVEEGKYTGEIEICKEFEQYRKVLL